MRRALLYLGLLTILTGTFLLHNHSITAFQPTSRGIGLIVIGAALGISSTLLQGFYKNLNADPGFMGITTGSVLGAILGIHLGFQFGSRIGILIAVGFALIFFYIFDWASKSFLTNGILITLIFSTFILLLTERAKLDGTYWTLGSFKELDKRTLGQLLLNLKVDKVVESLQSNEETTNSTISKDKDFYTYEELQTFMTKKDKYIC